MRSAFRAPSPCTCLPPPQEELEQWLSDAQGQAAAEHAELERRLSDAKQEAAAEAQRLQKQLSATQGEAVAALEKRLSDAKGSAAAAQVRGAIAGPQAGWLPFCACCHVDLCPAAQHVLRSWFPLM